MLTEKQSISNKFLNVYADLSNNNTFFRWRDVLFFFDFSLWNTNSYPMDIILQNKSMFDIVSESHENTVFYYLKHHTIKIHNKHNIN